MCCWSLEQEKKALRHIFIAMMRFNDIPRELCIQVPTFGNAPLKFGKNKEILFPIFFDWLVLRSVCTSEKSEK